MTAGAGPVCSGGGNGDGAPGAAGSLIRLSAVCPALHATNRRRETLEEDGTVNCAD